MTLAHAKLLLGTAFLLITVAIFFPSSSPIQTTAAESSAGALADTQSADTKLDTVTRPAPQSIFAGTAIGVVLEGNGNEVPKSGEEMMKVLRGLGKFAQLPITFSAVDLHTRLNQPRVIITQRPSLTSTIPLDASGKPNNAFSATGGKNTGGGPALAAISTASLTEPNLEGRLFLAANMEKKNGEMKVKTFEFISWNSRKQKFDFGFIECDEVEPQIRLVDGVKCFSCHKNRGPILGQGPWSNTPHNDQLRDAVVTALGVNLPARFLPASIGQPRQLDAGFDAALLQRANPTFDGISVLLPQGPAVDAAVRMGSDLARDRNVYRAMIHNADGRNGLIVLLMAIAAPGSLEQNNQQAKVLLDQIFSTTYSSFADRWMPLHKNSSSTLIDFNPSGSMGTIQTVRTKTSSGWGGGSTLRTELQVSWSGSSNQIKDYDEKRADDHKLPSNHQPSNPKAFVRPVFPPPRKPSIAVNAIELARLIGLTEGDRSFMAQQLSNAAQQIGKPKVNASSPAKEVFSNQQFLDLFIAGEIPDREDFKDRFVRALNTVLKTHNASEFKLARSDYASGPNVTRISGAKDEEIPVVATTACIRCHDVHGTRKSGFNPIPILAFDPFDRTSREHWAKTAPANQRQPILARMLKRLDEDRDMPPEDSAEFDAFRMKDPIALDTIKDWLEKELAKAKGE